MKIIFTSDLHFPIRTDLGRIRAFAEKIKKQNPDVVILGGDLGECLARFSIGGNKYRYEQTLDSFSYCVEVFTKILNVPILVLAGNHDLWCPPFDCQLYQEDPGIPDSYALWKTVLPILTKETGAIWLENEPYYSGAIAIVGSYLHYDYSAADTVGPAAGMPKQYWAVNKAKVNNDGYYLQGLSSDIEFAQQIGHGFKARLEEAQFRTETKQIIVATHVPIVEEQVTRHPHDFKWSMGTPYFGCLSYDHWIDACNKISHLVCGHNHCEASGKFHRCDLMMSASIMDENLSHTMSGQGKMQRLLNSGGTFRNPLAICCGSDYGKPEFIVIETKY